MAKKKTAEERRRRAAEMRAQRLKEERRKKILTISGVSLAAALVLGLLAFAIFMEIRSRNISGVEEYTVGSYAHVDVGQRVDYEQSPPVGGDHWAYWQNCGVYSEALTNEFAVHSLEHGAVWITYEPDLPQDEIDALDSLYSPGDYLVVSPYEGEMDAPIVASSWGRQVTAETADDQDLTRFVQRYERGTDVPEPGASCSGGVAETATEIDAALAEGEQVGGEGMSDESAEDTGGAEGTEESEETGGSEDTEGSEGSENTEDGSTDEE
ncbi:DUF3105 domain-containing protein [Nocardiopsis aegyptia]|uniref:DUF3105 domain-containing protein n=1 Tax=Nocardiopsis aegyptia TaxID=220378 RepID=A0A7Z0EL56_9ACTN|nr:DUF3105 domain-containing protein [Nocardiopsis aegyptia]NYJ34115.1 hypothetical protein [Nocardiopsis aegyptia]